MNDQILLKKKNMIVRFPLIAFFVSSFSGYAQKCNYEYNKKDPITGKTFQSTSAILAGSGPAALHLIFEEEEKTFLIGLHLVLSGRNSSELEQGDTLTLVLENKETLSVRAKDQYFPCTQIMEATVMSVYSPLYSIAEEEVKKLAVLKITAVKIKLGSLLLTVEVPLYSAQKTKIAAKCILL
jgi:hypothetical protein